MTAHEEAAREALNASCDYVDSGDHLGAASRGIGWALLDLADAVRGVIPATVSLGERVPDPRASFVAKVGQRIPRTTEDVESADRERAFAEERAERRRVTHWDAGGDDSIACGAGTGFSTKSAAWARDDVVSCEPCKRIRTLVAERDAAREKLERHRRDVDDVQREGPDAFVDRVCRRLNAVEDQLDRWNVEGSPETRVNLGILIGQLRQLARVDGALLAHLALLDPTPVDDAHLVGRADL